MRYGSVCSGIEAATAAWHPLGWTPAFFAEIEKFPSSVLKHHYPAVPNAGNFTAIQDGHYDPIELLVGGTPCQDFSVAGLRAGMDGARGQLTVEFAHLAGRLRPRWLVWENVPGVLSIDGGRAFGTFLGLLGQLGYGISYRVLDAQHFGVPQRRRRVFVVGHLGDWRRAAAVLFERHSLSGYPPPRREKGQGFTHELAPSLTGSGSGRGTERTGESRGQDPVIAVAPPLTSNPRGDHESREGLLAICMSTGQSSAEIGIGIGTTLHCGHEAPRVTHSLRADGFDASEDGTGRGTPLVVALQAGSLRENPESGPDGMGVRTDGIAYTIEARSEVQAIAYRTAGDGAVYEEGNSTAPLTTTTDPSTNIVAFRAFGQDGFTPSEVGPPITATDGGGAGVPTVAFTVSAQSNGFAWEKDVHPSLQAHRTSETSDRQVGIRQGMAVRRLTPRECERLQGFPDDYTKISDKIADGPRYKALGNSMAVPVMRWIGERIQMVENLGPLIRPHAPTDLPLELCLTEEILESVGDVDGITSGT